MWLGQHSEESRSPHRPHCCAGRALPGKGKEPSGGLLRRKLWSPLTRRLGVNVCLLGHDIGSDPDPSFRTPPESSACQLPSPPLLALSLLPNGPKCLLQSSHHICDERGRKETEGIFLEWLLPFTAKEFISTPAQHTLPGGTPSFPVLRTGPL